MKTFWLAIGAALLATPAVAQSDHQTSTPNAPAPAAAADSTKKVCRHEQVTGSNMRETVCHTPAEWDQIAKANEEATRRDFADQLGARRPR